MKPKLEDTINRHCTNSTLITERFSFCYFYFQDVGIATKFNAKDANGWIYAGEFNNFGVAEGQLGAKYGPIAAFRLNVGTSSENWAILSEIYFKPS